MTEHDFFAAKAVGIPPIKPLAATGPTPSFWLAPTVLDRHSRERLYAVFVRVHQRFLSPSHDNNKLFPEAIPRLSVGFAIKRERGDATARIRSKKDCSRNICCEAGIHVRILTEVDFRSAQLIQLTCVHLNPLPLRCVRLKQLSSPEDAITLLSYRELFHEVPKRHVCTCDCARVGHGKHGTYPLSDEMPSDCWSKQRSENAEHGADARKRIPIETARCPEGPTLAHAIQHAHSLIPLWTAGHSATPMRPEEITHG